MDSEKGQQEVSGGRDAESHRWAAERTQSNAAKGKMLHDQKTIDKAASKSMMPSIPGAVYPEREDLNREQGV
jgi:hypothetical protein